MALFQQFGKIVDFKRPTNLGKHRPSQFAFIRYERDEDGQRAIEEMDYRVLWESRIQVTDGNKQNSYFTQDTGQLIACKLFFMNIEYSMEYI